MRIGLVPKREAAPRSDCVNRFMSRVHIHTQNADNGGDMSEVRGQGARLQPPGRCDATGQQAGQGVHVCVRLGMHIYEYTSMMGDVGGDTGNWMLGG